MSPLLSVGLLTTIWSSLQFNHEIYEVDGLTHNGVKIRSLGLLLLSYDSLKGRSTILGDILVNLEDK
jgi:hypothetical protein